MDLKVLQDISYGMYIVSANLNGKDVGCTINTLTQVNTEPVVSICLNKNNYTNEVIKETKKFCVSILSEKTSKETISRFGYFSSRDENKFFGINYDVEKNIKVVNDNICGYLVCSVIDVIECGTHDVFIAKVEKTNKVNGFVPMTYKYFHENLKGKSPKNAPTYVEEEKESKKRYKCKICGYIYDGEIPFDELGDDFKCPLCGAPKNLFEEI